MGGFFVDSEENWKCVVDGSVIQVVTGNKNEWIGGHTLTIVRGKKTFHIKGLLEELFAGVKIEVILPWEIKWVVGNTTDVHVGGKLETIIAISFEINKAWTFHFGIPGQKTFITQNKLESLEDELLVNNYKQKVGQEYQNLVETIQNIGTMDVKIKSMNEQADSLSSNIVNWWIRTSYMEIKCNTLKMKITSQTKYQADSMYYVSKGTCHIKGGSIKLDGGGATLSIGGGVMANTLNLTA